MIEEKPTLLIVDDKPENLRAMRRIIEPLDVGIEEALSGQEALRKLLYNEIFLILMDVQMPEMDGFETAKLIKDNRKTSNIPIIFVTAINKEQRFAHQGYQSGAVDYIYKPIDPLVLNSKIMVFRQLWEQKNELLKVHELLKKRTELLEEFAFLDGLTNIPNRRSFEYSYKREWGRAMRTGQALFLFFLDVDYFKNYNDEYGHAAGDRCLCHIADELSRCLNRESDIVARYGGEEFIILLPEVDMKGAKYVAEKVRRSIEELKIPHLRSEVAEIITLSIGLATCVPQKDQSMSDLLEAADRMLYKAKQLGRNRVACCE